MRQTLEPRLLLRQHAVSATRTTCRTSTPAPKDFNFDSIFTENPFSGVDRVSDAHQLTAGVTSRVLDPDTGAEALRLGLAQRYRFRDQRVTPDGVPLTQRFSDVLLLRLDHAGAALELRRLGCSTTRTATASSARSPACAIRPGRIAPSALTYRLTRGLSRAGRARLAVAGLRPGARRERGERAASGSGCGGTLYSVGRVNYSTRDSRLTDSIVGLEYDAGCWIGRVVVERLSTGRSEATTRLLLQLELVGLSRIGSNPLRVLKDNVPGYQLLREERTTTSPFTPYD